jgi:hypothetical protein
MSNIKEMLHRISFWFLILFLLGVLVGGYGIYCYQRYQLSESILIGAFVVDKKVYDIKMRP